MPKVLIEIKSGAVMNVQTTSDDVEVYVVDHDVISDGSISELKHYLAEVDIPVDVDAVVLEDDLMTRLEDLIDEGKAKLEDMTEAWEVDEENESGEVYDLARVMRSGR
jgi:hypothetical protein